MRIALLLSLLMLSACVQSPSAPSAPPPAASHTFVGPIDERPTLEHVMRVPVEDNPIWGY